MLVIKHTKCTKSYLKLWETQTIVVRTKHSHHQGLSLQCLQYKKRQNQSHPPIIQGRLIPKHLHFSINSHKKWHHQRAISEIICLKEKMMMMSTTTLQNRTELTSHRALGDPAKRIFLKISPSWMESKCQKRSQKSLTRFLRSGTILRRRSAKTDFTKRIPSWGTLAMISFSKKKLPYSSRS